jgi:hypothetical protein
VGKAVSSRVAIGAAAPEGRSGGGKKADDGTDRRRFFNFDIHILFWTWVPWACHPFFDQRLKGASHLFPQASQWHFAIICPLSVVTRSSNSVFFDLHFGQRKSPIC